MFKHLNQNLNCRETYFWQCITLVIAIVRGAVPAHHPGDRGLILGTNNKNFYLLTLAASVLWRTLKAFGPNINWYRGLTSPNFALEIKPFFTF